MSDSVTNDLLLEPLERLREETGAARIERREIRDQSRAMKAHMAAPVQSDLNRDSQQGNIFARPDRIERRLDPEDPRVLEREGRTVERLYLGQFRNALASLGQALNALSADPENGFLRDSAIKRFEYSYESATKMIARHLSLTEDDPIAVKSMSFQDKIRRAYQIGLIPNGWDRWWEYRDDRAAAHAYSKKRAERIVQDIPAFYREANVLLDNLSAIHEAEI